MIDCAAAVHCFPPLTCFGRLNLSAAYIIRPVVLRPGPVGSCRYHDRFAEFRADILEGFAENADVQVRHPRQHRQRVLASLTAAHRACLQAAHSHRRSRLSPHMRAGLKSRAARVNETALGTAPGA